jgi:RNA polymerase sigma factor (sigma-70 family)
VEELQSLVMQARHGSQRAYEQIVYRFQDMAVGYSYAILGDLPSAEDAAQEAFIHAYYDLPMLRDPAAFPGWFRRIIFKYTDRIRRRRRPQVSLDLVGELAGSDPDPAEQAERHAETDGLYQAVGRLNERQREVLMLYYISNYSQEEISTFLEIPLGTVKSRLRTAIAILRERMIDMIQENLTKQRPSKDPAFTQRVSQLFNTLIGRHGRHTVTSGNEVYMQPHTSLSFHLVQMLAAGWEVDFDEIAAVSGASALFAYQPDSFFPRHAPNFIDPDRRIAAATGFGYEWVPFQGLEGAWQVLVESIDSGRPLKGWDWENILFSDYRDDTLPENRQVFAMADGPETYARWLSWGEFADWVKRVEGWHMQVLGRFKERIPSQDASQVARQVMRDLVAWSETPPSGIEKHFPQASFGLQGIADYARDLETIEFTEASWLGCHAINPQWAIRNSTAVYLERVVKAGCFDSQVNQRLQEAAKSYRSSYDCWKAYYLMLGHNASDSARHLPERRAAGAALARAWLAHEQVGLGEVKQALDFLDN